MWGKSWLWHFNKGGVRGHCLNHRWLSHFQSLLSSNCLIQGRQVTLWDMVSLQTFLSGLWNKVICRNPVLLQKYSITILLALFQILPLFFNCCCFQRGRVLCDHQDQQINILRSQEDVSVQQNSVVSVSSNVDNLTSSVYFRHMEAWYNLEKNSWW